MNKIVEKVKEIQESDLGITLRKIVVQDTYIYLFFITQIVNRNMISESIIKPILNINNRENINIDFLVNKIICADDISIDYDAEIILEYILNGNTVLITSKENKYLVINTKKVEKRAISPPEVQSVLVGPKDCFSENFDTNISLIRYRIKDKALKIDNYTVGDRTKTNVAIVYLKDVANERYVNDIRDKIVNIKVDGVLESGYIKKFLTNNSFSLFPRIGIAERSDSACAEILDGKVCVVVEGSNLALIAPKTFIEFSDSGDDHYQNIYVGIMAKAIRLISLLISLLLSSLYVALVGFHIDFLPIKYSMALAAGRANVPFTSFYEALFAELLSEILREASTRLTKQIGPAIGIVGTIVIGQAAVAAELISPLMVIIIALSIMCSFVAPDFTIMNSIRVLKFMVLFLTGILGIFGFTIGIVLILTAICSAESLGVSYTKPIIPFHWKDLKNFIFSDVVLNEGRPEYLHNKDDKSK